MAGAKRLSMKAGLRHQHTDPTPPGRLQMYSGIAKSLHEREEPDEGNRSIWARLMKLKVGEVLDHKTRITTVFV